jgi:hypothetical protein
MSENPPKIEAAPNMTATMTAIADCLYSIGKAVSVEIKDGTSFVYSY